MSCQTLGTPSKIASIIRATTNRAVARLLASDHCRNKSSVSFVEFGEWYNSTGHIAVPWIELLDTSKWPNVLTDGGDDDEEDE